MTAHDADRVRRTAGVFRLEDRALLEVAGGDRVRWLDGMITNQVSGLAPGPERSGCHALLLTHQGRIVADLHVLVREGSFWLEMAAAALPGARERLAKFIVADDVDLLDRTGEFARLAIEGPAAPAVLERALGAPLALSPHAGIDVRLGGDACVVSAFGFSGERGFQIFAPAASADRVAAALAAAGEPEGVVSPGADVLEVLRIEAGRPRFGAELDESVLPAEARLEDAVSTTKGCYTGQEVVARLASQGRVKHLLVGLRADGAPPLEVGARVEAEGKRVGEVTSACLSPHAGSIALAFVSRPHDAPGTALSAGGRAVRVAALPFVAPAS